MDQIGTGAEERNGLQKPRVLRAGTGQIYRLPEARTMTAIAIPLGADPVPVGPGLSMFDPMFIGIDEFGHHVTLDTVYHNLLIAGEPGGGKSGLVNLAAATAALSDNTRL